MYDTQTGRLDDNSWLSPVESFLEIKKKFSQGNETLLSADAQLKPLKVETLIHVSVNCKCQKYHVMCYSSVGF